MGSLSSDDAPMTEGLDETRYALSEHLAELRLRLGWSILAIIVTTIGCLAFAPPIFEYSIRPLSEVLQDRARIETVLVGSNDAPHGALVERLEAMRRVRFRGRLHELETVRELVERAKGTKYPVDLILVDAETIAADGALVSDLLENIEPAPYVAYLVDDAKDPFVQELQLEGALVVLSPPRNAVLNRVVRRAAAAAGKSTSADKLVVLSPLEPFFAYIKIALVCGLFLACPIWLFQAWRFVSPGMYRHERHAVLPAILGASALFVSGGAFAYYVMFPVMFDVLVNQMMPASLIGSFTVDKYLSLLLRLTVAFGAVFELPLVMAALAAVGLVEAKSLRRFRKYAIVGAFVLSAVLTPADPLSQVMMAIPLVLFYEMGIFLAALLGRRRAERLAALAE